MKSNCSICHNDLFTSRMNVTVLKCGHPMHSKCFEEYLLANEFTCPLCSKSIVGKIASYVDLRYEKAVDSL